MSIRKIFVGILAVGLLGAQEPQQQPGQPQEDFRIIDIVNYVTAPVTVYDKNGNIVNGLTALDFQLLDNGKEQKITEDLASHPISMVAAVQASRNMEQLLPSIRKVGSLFSQLVLGESGEIAVLAFDHRIQTMTGFTSDADKISEAFQKLKPGSSTSKLNDAAMEGVNLLGSKPNDRRRILLLISETRDNGSEMHVRDVLTKAEFKNIVVYSVEVSHLLTSLTSHPEPPRPTGIPPEARHLPGGNIGTLTTEAQGQICCSSSMGSYTPAFKEIFTAVKAIFISNPQEVYTKFTGGREYSYMNQRGLEKAITDIGNDIHSQYLLTYLPNNQDEGGYHEITVNVRKAGLKVVTRPGYWSAPKPQ